MENFLSVMSVTARIYFAGYSIIGISCLLAWLADKQEMKGADKEKNFICQ